VCWFSSNVHYVFNRSNYNEAIYFVRSQVVLYIVRFVTCSSDLNQQVQDIMQTLNAFYDVDCLRRTSSNSSSLCNIAKQEHKYGVRAKNKKVRNEYTMPRT
jgi:hypothetical protein